MKKFYSKAFSDATKLDEFVNDNNIQKEDIVAITQVGYQFTLFWYA